LTSSPEGFGLLIEPLRLVRNMDRRWEYLTRLRLEEVVA